MVVAWNKFPAVAASAIGLIVGDSCASSHAAQLSKTASNAAQTKCEGAESPGTAAPTPSDPYPLNAGGWGPEVANGLLSSRWAENWAGMRAAGNAPPLKAIPLSNAASLTLSAEARLPYDIYANGQLTRGNDYQQGLFRSVLGADLRFKNLYEVRL